MIKNILNDFGFQNVDEAIFKGFLEPNYSSSADHAYIINKGSYFKEDVDITYFIKEKIVEMIAINEGIETVDTKYVRCGKYFGELTSSYLKDGMTTINGSIILNNYESFLKNNNLILPSKINNLKTIRNALKQYFDLTESQLDKIMAIFLKRYMLDLLTMQSDRTSAGWEVFVDKNNKFIALAPLYDSNKCLKNYHFEEMERYPDVNYNPFSIKLSYDENCGGMSTYEEICYFLNQSDLDTREVFKNLVNNYSPVVIENYCYQLLNSLGIIEKKLIFGIIRDYNAHYQMLLKIIKKDMNKEGRSL